VRNDDRELTRPTLRMILDATGGPCEPEERDLADRTTDGEFRWAVRRTIDARELDIDMLSLMASGDLESAGRRPETGPGLVHEPAPGEAPPPGYVHAH
jgi:hypothetical protein